MQHLNTKTVNQYSFEILHWYSHEKEVIVFHSGLFGILTSCRPFQPRSTTVTVKNSRRWFLVHVPVSADDWNAKKVRDSNLKWPVSIQVGEIEISFLGHETYVSKCQKASKKCPLFDNFLKNTSICNLTTNWHALGCGTGYPDCLLSVSLNI